MIFLITILSLCIILIPILVLKYILHKEDKEQREFEAKAMKRWLEQSDEEREKQGHYLC